jgi:hypothetical protein
MKEPLKYFPKLEKARQCLLSIEQKATQGHPLDPSEKIELAVELASLILYSAEHFQTNEEKQQQKNLAKMMQDPIWLYRGLHASKILYHFVLESIFLG